MGKDLNELVGDGLDEEQGNAGNGGYDGNESNNSDEGNENGVNEKKLKFVQVAERRVTGALKQIQLIGNLSNRAYYHFDVKQVDEIFEALTAEIEKSKKKFQVEEEEKVAFSFSKSC